MLGGRKPTRPPASIAINIMSMRVRWRSANSTTAFISEFLSSALRLSARCRAIDEDTSPGNDLLAASQTSQTLDDVALDQAWLDQSLCDRIELVRNPYVGRAPFVDNRISRNCGPGVSFISKYAD